MKQVLLTALALAGLVPAGAGVLLLTETWNDARGVLRVLFALLAGLAVTVAILPPLVYLGIRPSVPVVLGLGALLLAAGVAVERRRRARSRKGRHRPAVRLEPFPAIIPTLLLVLLAVRAAVKPDGAYDAFSNWGLKAKLLYFAGDGLSPRLDGRMFERAFTHNSDAPPESLSYPIGLPSLQAYVLDALGGPNFQLLHLLFVAFVAGFLATLWILLRPRVGTLLLAAGLVFIVCLPALRDQALSENADVALACFWVAAALLVGSWIAEGRGGQLALASVFAAGAAATKVEGMFFCAILWTIALVALLLRRERSRIRPLLFSGALVALSTVPWRAFVAVHGLGGHDLEIPPSRAADQVSELPWVLSWIGHVLVLPASLWAVPLAAAAAVAVLLLRREGRSVAAAFLVLSALLEAALVVAYLNDESGVRIIVETTAHRTIMTPTLLAAALLPLFLASLLSLPPAEQGKGPKSSSFTLRAWRRLRSDSAKTS